MFAARPNRIATTGNDAAARKRVAAFRAKKAAEGDSSRSLARHRKPPVPRQPKSTSARPTLAPPPAESSGVGRGTQQATPSNTHARVVRDARSIQPVQSNQPISAAAARGRARARAAAKGVEVVAEAQPAQMGEDAATRLPDVPSDGDAVLEQLYEQRSRLEQRDLELLHEQRDELRRQLVASDARLKRQRARRQTQMAAIATPRAQAAGTVPSRLGASPLVTSTASTASTAAARQPLLADGSNTSGMAPERMSDYDTDPGLGNGLDWDGLQQLYQERERLRLQLKAQDKGESERDGVASLSKRGQVQLQRQQQRDQDDHRLRHQQQLEQQLRLAKHAESARRAEADDARTGELSARNELHEARAEAQQLRTRVRALEWSLQEAGADRLHCMIGELVQSNEAESSALRQALAQAEVKLADAVGEAKRQAQLRQGTEVQLEQTCKRFEAASLQDADALRQASTIATLEARRTAHIELEQMKARLEAETARERDEAKRQIREVEERSVRDRLTLHAAHEAATMRLQRELTASAGLVAALTMERHQRAQHEQQLLERQVHGPDEASAHHVALADAPSPRAAPSMLPRSAGTPAVSSFHTQIGSPPAPPPPPRSPNYNVAGSGSHLDTSSTPQSDALLRSQLRDATRDGALCRLVFILRSNHHVAVLRALQRWQRAVARAPPSVVQDQYQQQWLNQRPPQPPPPTQLRPQVNVPDNEILAALGMSADDLDAEWEAAQAEAVVVLHNAMRRLQLTDAFHAWRGRLSHGYVRHPHLMPSSAPAAGQHQHHTLLYG